MYPSLNTEVSEVAQKDPTTVAQKWSANLSAAGPAYTAGVNAVKNAPNALAAAAVATWLANVQAAQQRYVNNNMAVTLAAWQQATTTKGPERLMSGATTALPKFQAFMQKYLPAVYGMVASLPPRGTYAQNKARASAMMDALHAAKGTF